MKIDANIDWSRWGLGVALDLRRPLTFVVWIGPFAAALNTSEARG